MLGTYICGHKPEKDTRELAGGGSIRLKFEFCFTGLDGDLNRGDGTWR